MTDTCGMIKSLNQDGKCSPTVDSIPLLLFCHQLSDSALFTNSSLAVSMCTRSRFGGDAVDVRHMTSIVLHLCDVTLELGLSNLTQPFGFALRSLKHPRFH